MKTVVFDAKTKLKRITDLEDVKNEQDQKKPIDLGDRVSQLEDLVLWNMGLTPRKE